MSRHRIYFINYLLIGLLALVGLYTAGLVWSRPSTVIVSEAEAKERKLPKNPFARAQGDYDALSSKLLKLTFATPPLQLPNIQNSLVYHGTSDRPDIAKDSITLNFALNNGKDQASVSPGEKLFLMYDRLRTPGQYVFSPGNRQTPLWIESDPKENEALVKLSMLDEDGNIVREPTSHSELKLPEKDYVRGPGSPPWEIGNWRVDGTLLARQRTRWFGEDRFLERHGGDDFAEKAKRQRLDFGEANDLYSVFVGMGETLVWQDGKWSAVSASKETHGHPLMQVKRIDERIMSFDLWDNDGKVKISLNLLKSKEPWTPQVVEQDFRFVSTRTRSQYIFEVKDERMVLRPQDWLILTSTGWEKLDTEEEIDDYVDRKLTGPLFIFDGVVKKDDRQVLTGTLYNTARSEVQSIELPFPQSNVTVIKMPKESLESQEPYGNGHE